MIDAVRLPVNHSKRVFGDDLGLVIEWVTVPDVTGNCKLIRRVKKFPRKKNVSHLPVTSGTVGSKKRSLGQLSLSIRGLVAGCVRPFNPFIDSYPPPSPCLADRDTL